MSVPSTPTPILPSSTMLYLVGLGLSDEKDVTVRGLEAIKQSERVYLEAYTSILGVGQERLVRTRSRLPDDAVTH